MGGMRFGLFAIPLLIAAVTICSVNKNSRTTQDNTTFYTLDYSHRTELLAEVKQTLNARYGLKFIKERRLGISVDEVFADAMAVESEVEDGSTALEKAQGNLRFFDRVRRVLARFADSHLLMRPVTALPKVYLGFQVRQVGGKYVVSELSDRITKLASINGFDLTIGSELVYLDAQIPKVSVQKLYPLISGSTPAYRKRIAVEAMTKRDFLYPENSTTTATFRTREGKRFRLKLRWKYSYDDVRLDALYFLEKKGFKHIPLEDHSWFQRQYSKLRSSREWFGVENPEKLVLRTGFVDGLDSQVGVLQIFSFFERQLVDVSGDTLLSFEQAVGKFLQQLEENKVPLIIDMRNNEGGHVELPTSLLEMLAKNGEVYPTYTESFRLTPGIWQMWQRIDPGLNPYTDDAVTAAIVQEAANKNSRHAGVWAKTLPIMAGTEFGSFNQPIVAMLAPKCVSACDILAILFESSSRAIIMGQKSGGTGAGYLNWEPYRDSEWTDYRHVIKLNIPNMLFGHSEDKRFRSSTDEDYLWRLNRENIPVVPNIPYQTTFEDIVDWDSGWYDKALKILDKSSLSFSE